MKFFRTRLFGLLAGASVSLSAVAAMPEHRPVLLISIDGLRPEFVTHADQHGIKVPVLRGLLRDGAYAEGVMNVTPTYTYPNHTTLVTGVWPAEHGIYNNAPFDPTGKELGRWNWYAALVKVPTIWQAAHNAGLVTASIHWPVTMNAQGIDYNVPEFWFSRTASDHYLLEAVSQPKGYLETIEQKVGSYYPGASDIGYDELLTKTTIAFVQDKHPDFMTIHIVSLDHVEHAHGPLSPEANRDLEQIDEMVGRIISAERAAHPDSVIGVVSDHGFLPVTHVLNLNLALANDGLITVEKGKTKTWKAFAWESGGTAVIILKDPNDNATKQRVSELLDHLAADPANGIQQVLSHDAAVALGATAEAVFLVDMQSGFKVGGALQGSVLENLPTTTGAHGYLPTLHPELRSAFIIQGPEIAHGKNLGTIDMRQIAPTLARVLGVSLPAAKMPALDLH